MWARSSAFLIWAAAAVAAVFWVLHLTGTGPRAPAHAQPAPAQAVARSDLTRVLGAAVPLAAPALAAEPAPAVDQNRFQLLGVIAPGAGGAAPGAGWATISVDGKPARTYRVGSVVDSTNILQKVTARGADIGPRGGAPTVSLKLTGLPVAATGRTAGSPGAGNGAVATSGAGRPWSPQAPTAVGPAVPAAPPTRAVPPLAEAGSAEPAEANPAGANIRRPGLATR